ncbi:hypothetical protein QUF58_11235 [Anaerolineales bacterium HSG24]|nr:hypothetical protein [Anaerolineales bacterium HSG24]
MFPLARSGILLVGSRAACSMWAWSLKWGQVGGVGCAVVHHGLNPTNQSLRWIEHHGVGGAL